MKMVLGFELTDEQHALLKKRLGVKAVNHGYFFPSRKDRLTRMIRHTRLKKSNKRNYCNNKHPSRKRNRRDS